MKTDKRVQKMAANISKIFDVKDTMYTPQKVVCNVRDNDIEITAESIKRESILRLEEIIAEKRAQQEKWWYHVFGGYDGKAHLSLTLCNLYHNED